MVLRLSSPAFHLSTDKAITEMITEDPENIVHPQIDNNIYNMYTSPLLTNLTACHNITTGKECELPSRDCYRHFFPPVGEGSCYIIASRYMYVQRDCSGHLNVPCYLVKTS